MNTENLAAGAGPLDVVVRALDPQRAAFERWALPLLGDNPTWRESGPCELAWQAWKAARPKRSAVGTIVNVAAALAQRRPLAAFGAFDDATHIGHRQFAKAYCAAEEDTRLLAVLLSDAVSAL